MRKKNKRFLLIERKIIFSEQKLGNGRIEFTTVKLNVTQVVQASFVYKTLIVSDFFFSEILRILLQIAPDGGLPINVDGGARPIP